MKTGSTVAGRYIVLRELGVGASGTTFLVQDQATADRIAALKCLAQKASEELVESFRQECALLQQLAHPHIARLLDYGEDKGRLFYTTEYIEGEDFVRACQDRDWNAVFALTVQACWALDYLHAQQIIHRDLKPANMLVGKIHEADATLAMERLRLKLIDFGLATSTEQALKTRQAAGTLGYMAPEVLAERPYDHRADLYSLGVVLYETALGRLPIAKTKKFSSYLAAIHNHRVDMDPLRTSDAIPPGFIRIIEGLICEKPAQRLSSAQAVIKQLNKVEDEDYPLHCEAEESTHESLAQPVVSSGKHETAEQILETIASLARAGEPKPAIDLIKSKWNLFRSEGNRKVVERFYSNAGHLFIEQGDYTAARNLIAELVKHPAFKDKASIEKAILETQLHYREGDLKAAKKSLRSLNSRQLKGATLEQRTRIETYHGLIMQGLKQYTEATQHFEQAASLSKENERPDHQTGLLINAATLYYEQGQWTRAYEIFVETEGLARKLSNKTLLATILSNLANLYLYFGRLRQAEQALDESLKSATEQELPSLIAYNLYLFSTGEIGKGNREKVENYLSQALERSEGRGTSQTAFHAKLAQGYFFLADNDKTRFKEVLQSLRQLASETDQASYALQVDWLEAKWRLQEGSYADYPVSRWLSAVKEDAIKRQLKNNLWQILNDQGELVRLQGDTLAAKNAYEEALQVIDELKKNVPKQFRQSFLRDRKKEKIRRSLSSLPKESKGESKEETKEEAKGLEKAEVKASSSFEQWSDINRRLLRQHDVDHLLEEILDAALGVTDAERGFVILSDHQELDIRAARNFDRETLSPDAEQFSYTIAREVIHKGESVASLDAGADERFGEAVSVHALKIRSVLCVPLLLGQRAVGLVYLDNRYRQGVLNSKHIEMIERLADQASLTLEHARLHRENREKIEELQYSKKLIGDLNARLEQDLSETATHLDTLRESMKREHDESRLRYSYDQIIGNSPRIKQVLSLLDRYVDTDSSVFIHGESGTGKELIARAFHFNGPRKDRPFIAENCAALADSLLESELFGHVRGAFTGADHDKIGLFQMAHAGTLFLDEIGDMSPSMQAKLLRVLQEKEIRRVGGRDYRKVDVRVITASHRDIRKMVANKEFRQDLYYRLNIVRVDLPPLRERGEDILILADHFLEQMAQEEGRQKPQLSKGAIRVLLDYAWPGNIRELQNEMKRLMILGEDVISPALLSESLLESVQEGKSIPSKGGLARMVSALEKKAVQEALERSKGNKAKAAQLLKIGRRTLYMKLKEHDISPHWGKDSAGVK